jgi:transcriptional regulator GlxA family with amidase domain
LEILYADAAHRIAVPLSAWTLAEARAIIQEQIEEAKQPLASTRELAANVALACGFVDQRPSGH